MNPGIQRRVAEFVKTNNLSAAVSPRVVDLVSEARELSKALLGDTRYGTTRVHPSHGWVEELGDVLLSPICVANSPGVDLETDLRRALAKYPVCLGVYQDAGSGR